jgi:hypothetical protein
MMLLVLTLSPENAAWSSSESTGPEEGKVASADRAPTGGPSAAGRGEGYEPEAEATKGEEIPATFGPIITDTAIPIEKGTFVFQPIFGFSFINSAFNDNWRRASSGGSLQSFSMTWTLLYGLAENLEVYAIIPYVYNWVGNVTEQGPNGETSANSGGLSDVNLTLKYRLVQETETLPTVSAIFSTTFPTGKFKNLNPSALNTDVLGGGAYVFTPGFNVSKYIKPFIVYGNLWYSMPTSFTDDAGKAYPGDFVIVNLAAEYPITKKWIALIELNSFWSSGRLFGPKTTLPRESLLSILPAIEYIATDKFSLALGLSIALVGNNSYAAISPLLSMAYAF